MKDRGALLRPIVALAITCLITPGSPAQLRKVSSAADLLKEGTYYQSIDDISDRAADSYRQIIVKYSTSSQSELAQYYLGTYYEKKFFILESRNNIQDWSSFNQAEAALFDYVKKYGARRNPQFLSDSYFALMMIAFRRGYPQKAHSWIEQMQRNVSRDRWVSIYKIVWSPNDEDVVKKTCDAKQLGDASVGYGWKTSIFDEIVRGLKDWANQNCRTVPGT